MLVKLLLFFSFLFAPIHLMAQALQPVYQQFTEQDGLPSNYLNCLFQDRQGFIWIGSDKGLTRFDGVKFKTYTTDDGLSGNMILDITEDESGGLWIGTFERGLCHFDGLNFECWGEKYGIGTTAAILIHDKERLLYSAGAGKLSYFDIAKKQSKSLLDIKLEGIDNAVIPIGEGQYLYPCGNRIFLISNGEKAEEIFFKDKTNSFFIKKGFISSDGKIWLLDSNYKSLLQVRITGQQVEVVERISGVGVNADMFELDEYIIANYEKANTYELINRKNKTVQKINNPHSGQNTDLLVDREKQLWLATAGYGFFVQKGYPYLYQLPQQSAAAYDIEILSNGNILVGGDKGIWLYNEKLELLGHQREIEQVRGIKSLKGIGLCAGTLQGQTYFFENENELLNPYPKFTTVVSSGFSGAVSTQPNEVVFSSYGAGLQIYKNQEIQNYDLSTLPNLMVEGLFQTSHGLWATSSSDGVLLLKDNRLFSKRAGLVSNNVYTVFESATDSIWIGSENGISRWNGKEEITSYTAADGFEGKRITAFLKDKNQELWAFSDRYLHQWKNQKWKGIKSLTFQKSPEGRVYDVAYDSVYHRVFVAATTGAFVLDLEKVTLMEEPIDFVLASLKSRQVQLDTSKTNILEVEDNAVRIDFSLPSYTRSEANECYFRLLGKGDSWTKNTSPTSFEYDNLSAGDYTLQVATRNPDGVKGSPRTLASFKILTPIWLRWWAILLEIILGIVIVSGMVAWYFRRKNEKRLKALQTERVLQMERERISRDLHDNIGAQLTNITYKLDIAAHQSHQSQKNEEAQQIEKISDETRDTMKLLRDTIWALQKDEFSLDDLANKLQAYLNRLEGISIQFQMDRSLKSNQHLTSKEVLHLFRIFQEAIQNIIKHAEASEAKIILVADAQQLKIEIVDNGKGFAPSGEKNNGHYGLENMAFRAKEIGATFSIKRNSPSGTRVEIIRVFTR